MKLLIDHTNRYSIRLGFLGVLYQLFM